MRLIPLLLIAILIHPVVAVAGLPLEGGDPTDAAGAKVPTRPLYPAALDQATRLRGLKERHPIQVDYVSREELERLSIELHVLPPAEDVAQLQARWIAFGLSDSPLDFAAVTRTSAMHVGAFYDFKRQRIVLPETMQGKARWGDGMDTAQAVIAHEIEHALQDQTFGRMTPQKTVEAALVTRALYEGDAHFVMFRAFSEYLPPETPNSPPASQVVMNNMSRMADKACRALASFGRFGAGPDQPVVGLMEGVFTYFGGARFLNALFRTGGPELMNKAFQARPTTTEQILHPDKYLAGEQPIPVPVPKLPPGHTELASGTLGELETRILLGFASWEWAKLASSGWGGDSFLVSRGPDGLVTLQWNTVWDSAEDAAQFAQLMELVPAKLWRSPGSGDWQVAPGAVVQLRKEKRQVLVVRGVPEQVKQLAAAMAAPGRAPALQPPLGAIELADDALPDLTASRISSDGWSNYEYGLKSLLPANAQTKIAAPGHLLQVRRSDADGALWGAVAFNSDPKAKLDALVERAKSENHLAARVRKTSESAATVAGAKGRQRDVTFDGSAGAGLRALVWPACSGAAQFSAVASWPTEKAKADALAWLESIQATGFDAPICVPPEKRYRF